LAEIRPSVLADALLDQSNDHVRVARTPGRRLTLEPSPPGALHHAANGLWFTPQIAAAAR